MSNQWACPSILCESNLKLHYLFVYTLERLCYSRRAVKAESTSESKNSTEISGDSIVWNDFQHSGKKPKVSLQRIFFVQASFFGVELFSHLELESMRHDGIVTNIKNSQMIVLQFRAEKAELWSEDAVLKYEREIANFYMK